MITRLRMMVLAALIAVSVSSVLAQDSDSSSVESAAMSAAGVSTSTSTATEPTTFWTLIAKVPSACEKCKAKICKSCCGQMINEMMKPLSLMTGGCVKCCPQGPAAGNPKDAGPAGAAAALAQCLESAPERIASVRYMATADCSRFPEVEKEMIQALRGDCSECVRYEAALAFNLGCCCTEKTIAALEQSATGGTKDGFPRENSPRVRQTAMAALNRCQSTYNPEEPIRPEEPVPPEVPAQPLQPVPASPIPAAPPETPAAPAAQNQGEGLTIRPVSLEGVPAISDEDRQLLASVSDEELQPVPMKETSSTQERSVFGIIRHARSTASETPRSSSSNSHGLLPRMWRSVRGN